MKVNVYSSIVISVGTHTVERRFACCCCCWLNVCATFAFRNIMSLSLSGHTVGRSTCVRSSFSHSIYSDATIWWWMIIEIGSSIELCDYLTTHSLEEEKKKRKKREINKNIARYLSSWFGFVWFFLCTLCCVSCSLCVPLFELHLTFGRAMSIKRYSYVCFYRLVLSFILALLFVLISATILLLCFVRAGLVFLYLRFGSLLRCIAHHAVHVALWCDGLVTRWTDACMCQFAQGLKRCF